MKSPSEIIEIMMNADAFSKWLGIQVVELEEGYCRLSCEVDNVMLNGFQIAHGGIAYSLADSCLAFASNSHAYKCMSIETSISHIKKVFEGDKLIATSRQISRAKKIGIYEVSIHNQKQELVDKLKGTVFISKKVW